MNDTDNEELRFKGLDKKNKQEVIDILKRTFEAQYKPEMCEEDVVEVIELGNDKYIVHALNKKGNIRHRRGRKELPDDEKNSSYLSLYFKRSEFAWLEEAFKASEYDRFTDFIFNMVKKPIEKRYNMQYKG